MSKETLELLKLISDRHYHSELLAAKSPVRCKSEDVHLNLGLLGEDRACEVWFSYSPGENATRETPEVPEQYDIHGVWLDANGVLVDIQSCIHDMDELVENLKACL